MLKKAEGIVYKILHVLEFVIAVMTLVVMVGMLAMEIFKMFTVADYFATVDNFLHNILTIVVGLEFVQMLLDLTPANTLEVLTMAIARHVILNFDDPVSNVASILCIAALFAVRRFLIPNKEMNVEFSEVE